MEQWKDQKERKNKGRIKVMKEQWKEWNNGTMGQWEDQKERKIKGKERNNGTMEGSKNNGRSKRALTLKFSLVINILMNFSSY